MINPHTLSEKITEFLGGADQAAMRGIDPDAMGAQLYHFFLGQSVSPFIISITVFVLAVFVGYYVVWKVTPALHSPLMSVTNAISSVVIVGAILATGGDDPEPITKWFGFIAVILASINIFGGFVVTHRMLKMFSVKK